MKAVILAGGLGTRLSEETGRIPKPMVEIGGKPILWHIMKIYSTHGINDFVICLGYKGHLIKEYFVNYYQHGSDLTVDLSSGKVEVHRSTAEPWRVTLVDTGMETMTGGRLRRIAHYLDDHEPFSLTYGDGVADVNIRALIDFHYSHGALATVTAISPPGRWGMLRTEGDRVVGFAEKVQSDQNLINGGFFILDKRVINHISGNSTIWEHEPMETLALQGQLRAYVHSGFWQAMDTLREKHLLEELWASARAPWRVW